MIVFGKQIPKAHSSLRSAHKEAQQKLNSKNVKFGDAYGTYVSWVCQESGREHYTILSAAEYGSVVKHPGGRLSHVTMFGITKW